MACPASVRSFCRRRRRRRGRTGDNDGNRWARFPVQLRCPVPSESNWPAKEQHGRASGRRTARRGHRWGRRSYDMCEESRSGWSHVSQRLPHDVSQYMHELSREEEHRGRRGGGLRVCFQRKLVHSLSLLKLNIRTRTWKNHWPMVQKYIMQW